jgi:hypothetical protein
LVPETVTEHFAVIRWPRQVTLCVPSNVFSFRTHSRGIRSTKPGAPEPFCQRILIIGALTRSRAMYFHGILIEGRMVDKRAAVYLSFYM